MLLLFLGFATVHNGSLSDLYLVTSGPEVS